MTTCYRVCLKMMLTMPNMKVEYKTVVLDVIRKQMQVMLDKEFVDDVGFKIAVEERMDAIILALRRETVGQNLESVLWKYPKDWVQAVKAHFAPKWFTRIYPIKYRQCQIDVQALYPQLKLPPRDYKPVYTIQKKVWEDTND